jgi:hypothetical protein
LIADDDALKAAKLTDKPRKNCATDPDVEKNKALHDEWRWKLRPFTAPGKAFTKLEKNVAPFVSIPPAALPAALCSTVRQPKWFAASADHCVLRRMTCGRADARTAQAYVQTNVMVPISALASKAWIKAQGQSTVTLKGDHKVFAERYRLFAKATRLVRCLRACPHDEYRCIAVHLT